MAKGIVFEIQRFCTGDGPGIRTTVFLKGCPLRCVWCHNAEGLNKEIQLFYNNDTCIGCRRCEEVCPENVHTFKEETHSVDFSSCTLCGNCVKECPNASLRFAGRKMTADEVLTELLKDKAFYETSGGGITISGGEPLFQHEFTAEIAKKAKEHGLHVCIETSGFSNSDRLKEIAQYIDLFLFDIKHTNPSEHKRLTGVENNIIRENLKLLSLMKKPLIMRCPIVPDCNDTDEHFKALGILAEKTQCVKEIHIEPYHPLGVNKYESLGMPLLYDNHSMMDPTDAKKAAETVSQYTTKPVKIS